MKVPFLDLKVQYISIKSEIDLAIQEVIDKSAFILGKSVEDFESAFAKVHQVKHCIGTSSGTDGNHLALWALEIKHGDEVIIPANTFIATAWGATLCGAKPVFVDCDKETYNIDPQKVQQAITKNTKAIVAVHLYGQPADMDSLKKIASENDIHLIEDAAQAHLAEYKGRRVGGLSEVASFSFYPGKNLGAYGEGGAITTNSDRLALKVKKLREHGQSEKYCHEIPGHNYRMEGIQGAVLGVKLKYLEKWTNERRWVAQKYKEMLADIERIKLPVEVDGLKHVYHLFVIRILDNNLNRMNNLRDKLKIYLQENNVTAGLHYPIPLHMQRCFENLGYKNGNFPVTEELANGGLSLPIFPELTNDQIEYVGLKIREFFLKN